MNEQFHPINYDVILMINTIHFFYKNTDQLFININRVRKKNSVVVVKFLNRDFLDNFDRIIKFDTNFVERKPNNRIKYSYSHVHTEPQVEYVYSEAEIIDMFYSNCFEVLDICHFYKKGDISWENYLSCFSVIVFRSFT